MDAADLLETHIKPYLLQSLGDADAILLAGSHARVLNGETAPTATAKKNSDYDFIVYFDELPARFTAAMFASVWLDVPGRDEPVSIDLKIIDRAYLDYHAQHTHEVRRFPFLFTMITDAYPIHDEGGFLKRLYKMAADFIAAGPAPLGPTQIAETQGKLKSLEHAMATSTCANDNAIAALEGLQMLANATLLTAQDWVSPIGRSLVTLRQSQPGQDKRLVAAFNKVNGGDYTGYREVMRDIEATLERRKAENNSDSPLIAAAAAGIVSQREIDDSNSKGDKIMLGQYLARMKDAGEMEDLRLIELKCVLWLTAKSYLCRKHGLPFAYGAAQAHQLDQLTGQPVLATLFSAIQREDVDAMYKSVNTILGDQSGVAFNYLERIYTEDLSRRRQLSTSSSAAQPVHMPVVAAQTTSAPPPPPAA